MSNLIKASFWISISELIFNISGYVVQALMGRILDPSGYGRFSIVITFTTMVIILVGRGIPISASKYLGEVIKNKNNRYFEIKKSALFVQNVTTIIITVIYFFMSPVFAKALKDPSLTPLFQISSLIIPSFALASFYAYYFAGIQSFKKKSIIKLLRSIFRIVFIVGFGYLFKVTGAIIGQALAPFLIFIVGYLVDPYNKFKLKNKPDFKEKPLNLILAKKLSSFAGPIVLFMLFYEFMLSMNLYFIKAIVGRDDLTGIYNAASTVSRIPYYLFFFMTIVLLPRVSELIANNQKEQTRNLLSKAFKYLFILLFPMTALLSLFSDSAIKFFYGTQYSPAGPIMSVLIFGFSFLTVFYIITFVLNGAGKNKFPVLASFIGMVINGFLNFILIKEMGLMGSALATTITAFLITIWGVIYTIKNVSPFINIFSIFKYFLASILIYYMGKTFFGQGRYIFFLWSAILIFIYFLLMILWKEIGKKDWNYVIKAFKKTEV